MTKNFKNRFRVVSKFISNGRGFPRANLTMPVLNVAIIGGGAAGLASAKCALEEGFKVTIYEQNEHLGGTWFYSDKIGKDEYGVTINSSMYQGLRTNLPHQVMEFPDHHYPEDTPSFPSQPDVLNYLHSYANRFDLKRHIKFSYLVVQVAPIEDEKWEIVVKNLPNNTYETNIFDAVFICNGHYSVPQIPEIPEADQFRGKIIHSHDFRTAEKFRDQSVLVVGGGSSGVDIVAHLGKTASNVTFSQHKVPNESRKEREERENILPSNTKLQDDVKRYTSTGVEFIDGSRQTFDVVIYATGYHRSFRFLSQECGIHVDNNFVQPLYKQILNVNHPTMAFICIISSACYNYVSDLQARFALKYISGAKKLPSKSQMMLEMRSDVQQHWDKGFPKNQTHTLGKSLQRGYCKEISELADIKNIPDVMFSVFTDHVDDIIRNSFNFRNHRYNIVNEKTFEKKNNCE